MVDLLIEHAAQVVTVAGPGPRRGKDMADIGVIADGAVAIAGERIVAVGPSREVRGLAGPQTQVIDATGRVVMPGFVDAHTHLVFAGDRVDEFEERLRGATYLDILARGGGILSTVRATRQASAERLLAEARARLDRMLACGTTTVEAKTGYGLDLANEMKMLAVVASLERQHPVTVVPTFLAAHAVPPEFTGDADGYVAVIVNEMLPEVQRWGQAEQAAGGNGGPIPFPAALFCDVFCDQGAFGLEQSRRVLTAAKNHGFGLKIHADEFASLGAAGLAAEVGAASAEHLAATTRVDMERMAAAGVIGVLLPGTTFGLGSSHYADAPTMVGVGMALALGTDLNPGTCYCESMVFMVALACRYLRLTPAEAICAATLNAAHATGVGHLVGSLEAGKLADVLIVDVPDVRYLGYRFGGNPVQTVIKFGRVVSALTPTLSLRERASVSPGPRERASSFPLPVAEG